MIKCRAKDVNSFEFHQKQSSEKIVAEKISIKKKPSTLNKDHMNDALKAC